MSRPASAAMLMGKQVTRLREPRPGTAIRAFYDALRANPGCVVTIRAPHNMAGAYLQDQYGLDVRHLGRNRWLLAGEWEGRGYIDFVAAANKSE